MSMNIQYPTRNVQCPSRVRSVAMTDFLTGLTGLTGFSLFLTQRTRRLTQRNDGKGDVNRLVLKLVSTTPSSLWLATPSSMKGKFLAADFLFTLTFVRKKRTLYNFPFIDEGVDCEARRGSRNNLPSLSSRTKSGFRGGG